MLRLGSSKGLVTLKIVLEIVLIRYWDWSNFGIRRQKVPNCKTNSP
jgi:hypothetical protein